MALKGFSESRSAQHTTKKKKRSDREKKKLHWIFRKKNEEKGHKRRKETACFVELTIKVATTYHYSEEEME